MKRAFLALAAGLALCAAAYAACYCLGTARARQMAHQPVPELGWLKTEFHLSDAEFARISELHASYQPHCAEMCRRIDAKNAEIHQLLARANTVTPEVDQKMREAQQLRAECQIAMLKHFFAVSQSMPP